MTTNETFILGFFVIITVLTILSAIIHVERERNVNNSSGNNSSDSLNGEDV